MIRFLPTVLISLGIIAFAQAPPQLVADRTTSSTSVSVEPEAITSASLASQHDAPLPGVPPLPKGKTSLLGGRVSHLDRVRDRLVLEVFGAKKIAVLFDERTRVFRDGIQVSPDELKNGDLAYVDTALDGTSVFARTIRSVTQAATGQSNGQIMWFDAGSRELTLRDSLSPEPVRMLLASNAAIVSGDHQAAMAELKPGTLVALTFTPQARGLPLVRQISIFASPGATFVFAGRVAHFDLHRGLLVLTDPRDNQNYEVSFDPSARYLTQELRQDASVTVDASFDGTHYRARSITVNPPSPAK